MTEPAAGFIWHDSPVPPGLPVTQVYGWLLCPATGRVLVQEQDDGTHSLPGGTPEPYDADLDATLAREAFEENQVRIAPAPAYLGYQEVFEPGRPPSRPGPDGRRHHRVRAPRPRPRQRPDQPAMDDLPGRSARAPRLGRTSRSPGPRRRQRRQALGLPVDNPAPDGYQD